MKTHKHLILFAVLATLSLSACSLTAGDTSSKADEPIIPAETSVESQPQQNSSQEETTTSAETTTSSAEQSSSVEQTTSAAEQTSSADEQASSQEVLSSTSQGPVVQTKYTITWKNSDNSTLDTTEVNPGDTPTYSGEIPTKAGNNQYEYAFEGWSPEIVPASSDATYTATYTNTTKKYTITWKNYDGSTLDTKLISYGTTPQYSGSSPTRTADDDYTYNFSSWTPAVSSVTGDATYTATFAKRAKVIYFTNNQNWNNLKYYAWGGTGAAMSWPGSDMAYHRKNEYGEAIYSISGMDKYEKVIFNGSGGQTVDISLTNLGDDNAFFPNGQKDGGNNYKVTSLLEEPSNTLRILHCFDWSLKTIKDNLDDIASQGFNAIQTSPLQAAKDYNPNIADKNSVWWRYYQPVSLSVADKNTSAFFQTTDGDAELRELTGAASERGIKVIVDVVVNHLGDGSGNGGLHPSVATHENYIYTHTSETLHSYGATNDSSVAAIVKGNTSGVDLNTANSKVQERVRDFLKQLIDDGVSGFRFDAAKHIETPNEQDGCASSFWANTLGVAKTYASSKGITLFSYGEVLNPGGDTGKRSYSQYIDSAGLDAVTDSIIGEKYRASISSGYWTGLSSTHNVIWGESHDDYLGEAHNTTSTDQGYINDVYNYLARDTNGSIMLYFARPDLNANIGSIDANPGNGWRNAFIRKANLAHH